MGKFPVLEVGVSLPFFQQQGGHCERSAVRKSVVEVCSSGIFRVYIALGNVVIKDFGFYSMVFGKNNAEI